MVYEHGLVTLPLTFFLTLLLLFTETLKWLSTLCRIIMQNHSQLLEVEELLYVHRNRRLIRDRNPGRPPQLSHTAPEL